MINQLVEAFYKLHEILIDYKLIKDNDITSIAEGPGGFIQSILYNYDKMNYRNK